MGQFGHCRLYFGELRDCAAFRSDFQLTAIGR